MGHSVSPARRLQRRVGQTLQVLVDVTLLTVIMWTSGGYRSGKRL